MSRFAIVRHVLRAVAIAVMFAALFVLPAFAQAQQPTDPTDIKGWLDYLMSGGASVAITLVLSIVAERVPAWAALDSLVKWTASVLLSAGLGLGAWAIVTYVPAETLLALRAPFAAVILSVLPLVGGQLYHRYAKA